MIIHRTVFVENGQRVTITDYWSAAKGLVIFILRFGTPQREMKHSSVSVGVGASKEIRATNLQWYRQNRGKAINKLGGKCVNCGETDLRVLQVNHLNGGGGKDDKGLVFYRKIVKGERDIEDLDVRCANCNILYEYEAGRRI